MSVVQQHVWKSYMARVPQGTKGILENYSRVKIALICFTAFFLKTGKRIFLHTRKLFHLTNYIYSHYVGILSFPLLARRSQYTKSFCFLYHFVGKTVFCIGALCIDNDYLQKENSENLEMYFFKRFNFFGLLQTTIIFLFNNFLFLW